MPVIEHSIVIKAPAEAIFAVEDDPTRLPEYMPGIDRITDYSPTPERIGDSATFTYKVLGLRFDGKGTVHEREENRRLVIRLEGGIEGTQTGTYEPQEDATKVTWRFDYTMQGGIPGKLIGQLFGVERMNEKNAQRGLENLKRLCEGSEPPASP